MSRAITLAEIRRDHPTACAEGLRWLAAHWPQGRESWTLPEAIRAGAELSHACWLAARLDEHHRWALVTWAADCAERVLPVWEAAYPDDDRPRRAIEAARAGDPEAADAAAWAAADAAWAAADAAWAAADAAAAAEAARAAAEAARAAARAAAWAAEAARAAAEAARAAARAADAAAAWAAAERVWQRERLAELLTIEEPTP